VACGNEPGDTVPATLVPATLVPIFERYGLPQRLLEDTGPPWGHDREHQVPPLTVWLLRLGTDVGHRRPSHPQTGGTDDRVHRTLKAKLRRHRAFADLAPGQQAFDPWRDAYTLVRPPEALGWAVPASRYPVSPRPSPAVLPPGDRS